MAIFFILVYLLFGMNFTTPIQTEPKQPDNPVIIKLCKSTREKDNGCTAPLVSSVAPTPKFHKVLQDGKIYECENANCEEMFEYIRTEEEWDKLVALLPKSNQEELGALTLDFPTRDYIFVKTKQFPSSGGAVRLQIKADPFRIDIQTEITAPNPECMNTQNLEAVYQLAEVEKLAKRNPYFLVTDFIQKCNN